MNKRILWMAMAFVLIFTNVKSVSATTISDAKNQKKQTEKKLDKLEDEIEDIEGEKEDLEEEATEYQEQLESLLLNIQVIESDIEDKKIVIDFVEKDLEIMQELEEEQRIAMNKRIKYMYEKGNTTYVEMLLESKNYVEAVNKATYSEKLYEYDRLQLYKYAQTKQLVQDKKQELEDDLSELTEIEADLTEQKAELQLIVDEYSETIENFDEELEAAKKKATQYKDEIKKQSDSIRVLEEEEKKKKEEEEKKKKEEEAKKRAEEEAKKKRQEEEAKANKEVYVDNADSSDNSASESESSSEGQSSESQTSENQSSEPQSTETQSSSGGGSGSAKGQEIANFACQFVGNPYVPGGTSLTNGADCSGFTLAVYNNFGISLPRSSYAQSGYGREVSYSEAQPGDIIYYGGHVGIYIGNGLIVHASTQATGIKISNALYRSIITVRRIVD